MDSFGLEVGGGGIFLKVGFFSPMVFGNFIEVNFFARSILAIFLRSIFLQGRLWQLFKGRFFCKVGGFKN